MIPPGGEVQEGSDSPPGRRRRLPASSSPYLLPLSLHRDDLTAAVAAVAGGEFEDGGGRLVIKGR